ncbi:MAG: ATP-binding cassette domain-containing protein [Acutalibacteraceae bacterium]
MGLIKGNSGSAEIFGKDIVTQKKAILSEVGHLPSEALFYNGMRVKDVIRLSADLRKKDCSDEAKKLCDRLNLDTMKKVEELSFGNRKKVAIVCALQHKPRLCILTANLRLDFGLILLGMMYAVICIAAAYIRYSKKDIS